MQAHKSHIGGVNERKLLHAWRKPLAVLVETDLDVRRTDTVTGAGAGVQAATIAGNSLPGDVFPNVTGAVATVLASHKCTLRMANASAVSAASNRRQIKNTMTLTFFDL